MEIRTIDEFGKVVIPRQLRIQYGLATVNKTIKCLHAGNELLLYPARKVFTNTENWSYNELHLDDLGRLNVISVLGCYKRVSFNVVLNSNNPNELDYIQMSVVEELNK